jgi:hypothetical protein
MYPKLKTNNTQERTVWQKPVLGAKEDKLKRGGWEAKGLLDGWHHCILLPLPAEPVTVF